MAISLLALGVSTSTFALTTPRSLPQDKRIKVVAFEPSNVASDRGSTFGTTQILINKTEVIEMIETSELGANSTGSGMLILA